MNNLISLAWRNVSEHRLRTALSATAVSAGVAMTLAADYVSNALLAALTSSGEGDLQITHGFIVEQFDQMLNLIGVVLLVAAAFLVFNAFAMTVTQRRQQFGLLRVLGATRRQILRLALLEGMLLAGVGTVLGLLLGPLLGRGIVLGMRLTLGDLLVFGQGQIGRGTMVTATFLGLSITLLAVLLPARHATQIPPIVATHNALAEPMPAQRTAPRVPLLLLAVLLAVVATRPGDWLPAPWNLWLAVLGVLVWLAGWGWLLPWLTDRVGRWTRRRLGRRWVPGRVLGDNLRRAQRRVALTILTLSLGIAMISGLTGFMHFAVNDLLGEAMARMVVQHTWAIFPFDLEAGVAGLTSLQQLELPPDTIAAIETVASGRADTTLYRFALIPELSLLGESYFTYVIDVDALRRNPSLFHLSQGEWATVLPLMEPGCGALVTPLVAQRLGVEVGETVTITGQNGPVPCTIAGLGAGYGNASLVGDHMAETLGATAPIGLALTPRPGTDIDALAADLAALAAQLPNAHVTLIADFVAMQTEMMTLFNAAFDGLLVLAIGAAALGVINTTLMSVYERRRELGVLRAVGATQRQVQQVVTGEAALMGLLGGGLGVVAGAGSAVIIVLVYGGRSWGVLDLALWPAAGATALTALAVGAVGVIVAPVISAAAAHWPIKRLLRETTVGLLD